MQPAQTAYDRAITVFSPDGRLFQVEYAREAVKRGTTALGIKVEEGVVLGVDKRVASKLIEPESIEKVYQIDTHIGAATAGLVADARVLVERARIEAQTYRYTYGEPIDVDVLVKAICDLKQVYTQHGGVRPFGTALLIAGVDRKGCRLFETDPSGALTEHKATAIGEGRQEALDVFEEEYREDMTLREAVKLAVRALYEASREETTADNLEIAVVDEQGFRKLEREKIEEMFERAVGSEKDEGE
ncbi:archaeal proteasome endopeptidase complex subunit alpha [Methanopyrus sp. KOL6]|uniref:archaeal proteasome endopeptidase complex subunit alpha n=1 Tax=Methanopyrus sp. KOL6 TaxID=1937004 RepID=UPI000B4AD62E|nr:archaeal proteasome endopeptidase complex subunit alpha [Methanopyrus sp. KOL6]